MPFSLPGAAPQGCQLGRGGFRAGLRLFYYKPLISGFGGKPWSKQPLFRSKLPSLRLGIATPPEGGVEGAKTRT